MNDWKAHLKSDPTDWLLEPGNPSVRYFALRELLDSPAEDADVLSTRAAIIKGDWVTSILDRQEPGGYWGKPEDYYIRSKYRGTTWTIILLAELGVDGTDERLQRACEFILSASQDRISRGFAYTSSPLTGGDHNAVIPCLTGNMLFSLIRMGCLCDPRVQAGIRWAVKYQRFDDGIEQPPDGWPYEVNRRCWGKHTCHMAVVKILKALAEIPPDQRTGEVTALIQMMAEYLLKHQIYMSSHDPAKITMPNWLQFGFPLMWNTDVLEILELLTRLGFRDPRMQPAVDWMLSKQNGQGRWNLETTYYDRFLVTIERNGKPSKWITLNALRVLKQYYG